MISIESAFKEDTDLCRAAFLEASIIQGAQIKTLHVADKRLDLALVFHPQYSPDGSDQALSSPGLIVAAHTLEEAAVLIFALHDEGWQEKFHASSIPCIAYVLTLEGGKLDSKTLIDIAPGIDFTEVDFSHATNSYASKGELISLSRRALFSATDETV